MPNEILNIIQASNAINGLDSWEVTVLSPRWIPTNLSKFVTIVRVATTPN
jgi:hypothetical protein